ncbi:MAG: glutathione S-transferase family protein [Betaproteobacteria bacterium]|nr:glutathione S-transferase family protein [Betaproteobacteria bacterium]
MPRLRLVIANKNYSSWSMRPWVLLTQAGIPFKEVQLKFNDDVSVRGIEGLSPTGKVPVLWVDNEPVWDSLAIMETAAELFPNKSLWPQSPQARAHARSICAEMHSSFGNLRSKMVMNIRSSHPGKGRTPEVEKDIARIVQIWEGCRARFGTGGDLLFGGFSIADAMYAPVATRFKTYAVTLPPVAQGYADALLNLPAVQRWCEGGRAETEFVPADEPYAT